MGARGTKLQKLTHDHFTCVFSIPEKFEIYFNSQAPIRNCLWCYFR